MASEKSKVASVDTMHKAIDDFDGTNWRDFSFSVKTVLKANGCWATVDPGEAPAANASQETKEDWQLRNDRAFGVIALSCVKKFRNRLSKCETAKEAWERLKAEWVSNTPAAVLELEHRYDELLKHAKSPIRDWRDELEELADQLEDVDAKD